MLCKKVSVRFVVSEFKKMRFLTQPKCNISAISWSKGMHFNCRNIYKICTYGTNSTSFKFHRYPFYSCKCISHDICIYQQCCDRSRIKGMDKWSHPPDTVGCVMIQYPCSLGSVNSDIQSSRVVLVSFRILVCVLWSEFSNRTASFSMSAGQHWSCNMWHFRPTLSLFSLVVTLIRPWKPKVCKHGVWLEMACKLNL